MSFLNVKLLLGTFNQEKALIWAFSVIVKTNGAIAALFETSPTLHCHCSAPELLVLGPGRAAVVRGELHAQLRGGLLAGQLVQEVVTVPELPPQVTEAVLVVLKISSDIFDIIYSTRASNESSQRFPNHGEGLLLVESAFTLLRHNAKQALTHGK